MTGKSIADSRVTIQLEGIRNIMERIVFPVVLLLFPLVTVNQGVDLTDTGYSLGNYSNFLSMDGTWTIATLLGNVVGYLFTLLPFGGTMLGMKLYTSLIISFMALLAYRFFSTKMPKTIVFAGEMAAIGLCWCPTVILYNYMTYALLLLAVILIFRGLAGERPLCLVMAGVCLGLNIFVRFSNLPQAILILAVWYYGMIRKKSVKKVAGETLLCLGGYLGGLAVMFIVIAVMYGPSAYADMIVGLFSMTGEASEYTPGQMLYAIWDAYLHGMKWLLYLAVFVLPGIPFFLLRKDKFVLAKKVIYCCCIAFLIIVLGRWGMYNLKYYQKEAALQWAVVFLLVTIILMVCAIFSSVLDWHWKLICCMTLLVVLITPIGSNNHVWPAVNNLFFAAPVTFWTVYKFVRWGRAYGKGNMAGIPFFPLKAMLSAIMIMFLIQSIGVGCFYVFRDGEAGEKRNTMITENKVLKGMYTTPENARSLEELTLYIEGLGLAEEQGLILYGDIPALAYYLDMPPAIFSTWPDLDSNTLSQLDNSIAILTSHIQERAEIPPIVILSAEVINQMEIDNNDKKLEKIYQFMEEHSYRETYSSSRFILYQK